MSVIGMFSQQLNSDSERKAFLLFARVLELNVGDSPIDFAIETVSRDFKLSAAIEREWFEALVANLRKIEAEASSKKMKLLNLFVSSLFDKDSLLMKDVISNDPSTQWLPIFTKSLKALVDYNAMQSSQATLEGLMMCASCIPSRFNLTPEKKLSILDDYFKIVGGTGQGFFDYVESLKPDNSLQNNNKNV